MYSEQCYKKKFPLKLGFLPVPFFFQLEVKLVKGVKETLGRPIDRFKFLKYFKLPVTLLSNAISKVGNSYFYCNTICSAWFS